MTCTKTALAAILATGFMASTASAGAPETVAAEAALAPAAVAAPASPFDGLWAGVSLGKGYSDIAVTSGIDAPGAPNIISLAYPDSGASGSAFGLEAGYAKSFGSGWQWGVQVDHMATNIDASANMVLTITDPNNVNNVLESDFGYTVSIKSMTSVLGRIGYQLNDNTMFYGLGGLTAARAEGELEGLAPQDTNRSLALAAATFGFGIETLVAPKTSIKIEYRSTNFGSGSLNDVNLYDDVTPVIFHASVASRADTVRLALVHRF